MYAIVVGAVIYRKLSWRVFMDTLRDTTRDIGVVMILIAMSGIIGYGIAYDRVPQSMSEFMVGITENQLVMMLIAVLLLAAAGMSTETTVVALLLTPILVPVIVDLGIDPCSSGSS